MSKCQTWKHGTPWERKVHYFILQHQSKLSYQISVFHLQKASTRLPLSFGQRTKQGETSQNELVKIDKDSDCKTQINRRVACHTLTFCSKLPEDGEQRPGRQGRVCWRWTLDRCQISETCLPVAKQHSFRVLPWEVNISIFNILTSRLGQYSTTACDCWTCSYVCLILEPLPFPASSPHFQSSSTGGIPRIKRCTCRSWKMVHCSLGVEVAHGTSFRQPAIHWPWQCECFLFSLWKDRTKSS